MNALTTPGPQAGPVPLDAVAYQLLHSLQTALAEGSASAAPGLFAHCQALCSHLLGEPACSVPPAKVALSPWQERLAKRTMIEHMASGMPIAAVAAQCALSRSHFSRAFKKTTGLSPRDWLQQARIERARHLLAASSVPIAEVSLECGFADQSHFTRVFTRATGATPFNWRRAAAAVARRDSILMDKSSADTPPLASLRPLQ
ncbi:AraC family transcriptional regulator [Pseudomonas sp. HR96]|uniref:helix-turn-helix domain-containing protein n=1 Tax=Pseudomonas sp. HR96 TaxID=1027966 RepID=UPI002A762C18|nr:AraC family transcriptional regulator [Pseudomonas sp. HR96]WPP01578.1 AraC family transcriptional regulator [Pseudomonas sp. HR96]